MSQNYKMIIQYEGTRYDGWQKQGNTENTIQGRLEKVLERMAGCPVEVHGSGRTDAGVHAMGQVANFHLPDGYRPDAECIRTYLNQYLPDDIAITELIMVPERFHSRLSAVKKIYTYQIETGTKKNVFSRRTCYGLGQALDITAMQKAAELLCGTHDYKSFCGNKKMKKSTVRTIEKIEFEQSGSRLHIYFTGNGFLQQMVRILTGTLIEVGQGKCAPDKITRILDAQDRQAAGPTAPAQGLFLVNVGYEDK